MGRGRKTSRSQSHAGDRAHNDDLTETLKTHPEYSVEIAGPFGKKTVSALIESAIISAFKRTPALNGSLKNKIDGQSLGSFKLLGVPSQFATRPGLGLLTAGELHQLTEGRPAVFVLLKDKTLSDGRLGVDLAKPRGLKDTQERMVKWWELRRSMDEWRSHPLSIPSVLIGVAGIPKQRLVVGSLAVDDDPNLLPWRPNKGDSAAREVPVKAHPSLDFFGIRGRRVDPEIVKFGQNRSAHFRIVNRP